MDFIHIRIVRNRRAENEDDTITIFPDNQSGFLVTYKDGLTTKTKNQFNCTPSDAVEYVYSVLDLIQIDEDPFEIIQFDLPGYPSVMLTIKNLKTATIRRLMYVVRNVIYNWPFN